jgi:hypothetical protein
MVGYKKGYQRLKEKEILAIRNQFLKYPLASSSHQLAHLFKYSELCPAHKAGRTG